MSDTPVNWCAQNQNKFPCDLTAFNAAFIGAIASLAGGIMVVCLNMRVRTKDTDMLLGHDCVVMKTTQYCFLLFR